MFSICSFCLIHAGEKESALTGPQDDEEFANWSNSWSMYWAKRKGMLHAQKWDTSLSFNRFDDWLTLKQNHHIDVKWQVK